MQVRYMKVLVAVDKSDESQMALRYACHLLEHFDARIDALHVRPDEAQAAPESYYAPFVAKKGVAAWIDEETEAVEDRIYGACEICSTGKVPCHPRFAEGDPAEEILNLAEVEDYDMIVLGSHGRSSLRGFLLGTVHSKVLHHARQPILIVRNFRPIHRVLVAYRGSECDRGALSLIASLLRQRKPEITILQVQESGKAGTEPVENPFCDGIETLLEPGHTPVARTVEGDFVDEILKEVVTERYDLIVLGAYGKKRRGRFGLISDEALNIARLTTRPVLIYRDKSREN